MHQNIQPPRPFFYRRWPCCMCRYRVRQLLLLSATPQAISWRALWSRSPSPTLKTWTTINSFYDAFSLASRSLPMRTVPEYYDAKHAGWQHRFIYYCNGGLANARNPQVSCAFDFPSKKAVIASSVQPNWLPYIKTTEN